MSFRARTIVLALSLAVGACLGGGAARAAGFSDLVANDPQIRNAMDAAEAALESAVTRGEVTRGASGSIASLLYSADTLICASWQISVTQLEQRIVVENAPLAPPEQLLQAVMELRNRIVAACDRILQPEYADPVPVNETEIGEADLGVEVDDLRYLDGWGVVNDACYRQCFDAWLNWQSAKIAVERAHWALRRAELRLGALDEFLLPDLEREIRRLESELSALRSRPLVAPELPSQRDAKIAKYEVQIAEFRNDLADYRRLRDETSRRLPGLLAALEQAREAIPATLAALVDCIGRCPVTITWYTAAQEHRGRNGEVFEYVCDRRVGEGAGVVWGTDIYTDDSSICLAAVHAGFLTNAGGAVRIEILPGQDGYQGTERNAVGTRDWGGWGGSFRIVSP